MCQEQYNTNKRNFKQLTYKDRVKIEPLYNKMHLNYTEIGKIIGKDRTTISREIKKGLVKNLTSELIEIYVYSAEVGQKKNEENETAKGTNLKIGNDMKLASFVEKEIKEEKSSPEVIEYKIKQAGFSTTLCYKTIYNYIDKEILEVKRKDLTYGNYNKKEDKKEESDRIKPNKEGKTIHDRPEEIKTREEIGHWKMDLVEGLKGKKEPYLLVLSERKTRKEIIELIPNKEAKSVAKALDRIERKIGVVKFRETFKTITTDNGSEFRNWKIIEKSYTGSKKTRTTQYFADAYSSWQRGTNENINKMIRRFLPKGTSFKGLKQEDVKRIERWINNYPRKIFKFKTSEEYYEEEIKIA
jgi:IS30 family transposase